MIYQRRLVSSSRSFAGRGRVHPVGGGTGKLVCPWMIGASTRASSSLPVPPGRRLPRTADSPSIGGCPRRGFASILLALCVLACLGAASGCTGSASVCMVSLNANKLKRTDPLIVKITPERCYYWVDDSDNLCIAMKAGRRSIFGDMFSSEFYFSVVLDGLPAASTRTYNVDRRSGRLRCRRGLSHIRSASLRGLVNVWDYGERKLSGRFRFTVKQQAYFVLSGWGGHEPVLLVGEFEAYPGRERGEQILARSEDSMPRSEIKLRSRIGDSGSSQE